MATRPLKDLEKKMAPGQVQRAYEKVESLKAGAMIARLRQEAGLTQTELAERLGVTQQAVSQMEWGEEIKLPTLNRALATLGASLYVRTPKGEVRLTTAP